MGKYLVLIYGDEQRWGQASGQWQQGNAAGHRAFNAGAGSAVLGGDELEPTARAVSLRPDAAGRPSRMDGPFLETKEVIGGYYLLQAADMDEAIELAGQIPEATTPFSGVEIRPIAESSV
ncbi:MAG: YciI family protein [Pseudonocardiales bacterium]